MVELRPRRAKAAPADANKEETPKKPKTPKASKRKATEDVSPTATKKAKAIDTPAKTIEESMTKVVNPTPKPKKGKTPVKAKDTQVESLNEVQETPAPKSSKKSKTPAKAMDVETVAPQEAAETPLPKSSKKAKTPAKAKDIDTVALQDASEISAPKSVKKSKTPAKAKVSETTMVQETIVEQADKTPASKSKTARTPAKATMTETSVVQETVVQELEKTPASKSKNTKTPTKSGDIQSAALLEKASAPKAKKEKTPVKAKLPEESAPAETNKTPATKSKKDKTPAKMQLIKETPSKVVAAQPSSETVEKTSAGTKDQTASAFKSSKKTPKSVKKAAKPEPVQQTPVQEDELMGSDDELDEQTKNLIKTIDVEEEASTQSGVVLFEEGQDVGKIPEISNKQKKKAQKKLAAGSSNAKEETGVLYVGRLPHGFYEHEMRSYFSQFGSIRNLRVARNKQTGKAKHFAFVEFEEASTAEIVAKTMDNYLLFGHILKCSVIPKDQVHDELFKGANKRFKPVPWNKMEGKQMQRPLVEDKWSRKIAKENKRRADRAKKLEAIGYEYNAPELMDVDAAKSITATAAAAAENETEDQVGEAIEGPSATEAAVVEGAKIEDEKEADKEEVADTPKPAKRGRGRPAKAAAAEATPNKRVKRTKA